MPRRLHQTMADYAVIAISPALIMTLVGSLVFFLLAVFYQGEFALRLHWVMACFVFAAVLIGRISIEEGLERALPFGFALAMAVGIATNRFMTVQGSWIDNFSFLINWSIIALIWWCAHRLTWDCTVIDDAQDASGQGLLQNAGLERSESSDSGEEKRIEGTTSRQVPSGWWQRYVEGQHRPHAPGVWVVYFSLAALPLFGIGQWFIPATSVGQRRWAFWLLMVYVASGLGLLLTTSFLGLRRYLRQRRIEMPTLMANLWLGMGAVMILVLLSLATLLPRPSAEYAISALPFSLGSPESRASQVTPTSPEGTQDEQPGSAEQRENQQEQSEDQNQHQDDSPQNKSPGKPSDTSSPQQGQKEGSQSTQQEGKQSSSSKGSGDGKESSGSKKGPQGGQKSTDSEEKSKQSHEDSQRSDASKAQQQRQQQPTNPGEQPNQSTGNQQSPSATLLGAASQWVELVKTILYAILGIAVLIALWISRREVLAAIPEFWKSLRELLAGLLGSKRVRTAAEEFQNVTLEVPPTPFASYADPFASGIAADYSPQELVRYTFEAFEAWAREHDCPRKPDQTPHELARDVAGAQPFIGREARNLAELYARAAYAGSELPPSSTKDLQQLWQRMRAGAAAVPR